MNWTLFTSTFVMIFLAELGDKTQLAVMSQSGANASFRLTVFAAGSLALAASTAIGVLAGGMMQRWVPDVRYIKVAGGALFVIFGALMLREGMGPRAAAVTGSAPVAVRSVLGRLVLRQAFAFERAALDDYRALAAQASTRRVRELFEGIAAEEAAHGALMEQMGSEIADTVEVQAALPADEALIHDVAADAAAGSLEADSGLLAHALEHERATAAFYRALEQSSAIPSLRGAFARAAADEERHAALLQTLLEG